jgi:hypothetical protein
MSEPRIEDRPSGPDAGGAAAALARPAGRPVTWSVSGALILVFLVVDFITPQLLGPRASEWWLPALGGILVAEVNLIAIWAVLAPGNIVVRLPWAILLSTAMWYALVLGAREREHLFLTAALGMGAVVFFTVAVAQVNLWIAKKAYGWRLIGGTDDAAQSPQGPWQFNLRHLMLATFLLAVALSPLHKVLPPGPIDRFDIDAEFSLGLAALFILLYSLFVTIPCIWNMMSSQPGVVLALGWLSYAVGVTGLEIGLLVAIGPRGGTGGEECMLLLVMNVCQCLTIFATLRIYRALGFRFVRGRPPRRNP